LLLLILTSWRADPVDGITGEEDQKRNEECGADEDESYSCGRPGCPGHVDPPPHTTCIAAIDRDQLTAVVLSVADIERIKEAAYRAGREAGREDAARDILDVLRQREDAVHETYARRRALGVGDQAAEWAVRSRAWRQARQAAEEAAIAVGDGVQPTEEQPDE
jgi:hypothetical protein